jgi:hypothetical protein
VSRAVTLGVVSLALVLSAAIVQAAPLSPAARAEIDGLLVRLGASDCKFKRNGSWHSAAEARAHLQRKLDYLLRNNAVASVEQFIERAGSRSSVSGQSYLVSCGGGPAMESNAWLTTTLRTLRAETPR